MVLYLALGSVPGALATIYMMTRLPMHSPELTHLVTVAIGVALLLAAIGLFIGQSTELETDLAETGQQKRHATDLE